VSLNTEVVENHLLPARFRRGSRIFGGMGRRHGKFFLKSSGSLPPGAIRTIFPTLIYSLPPSADRTAAIQTLDRSIVPPSSRV